jgi:hypothetical protein
LPAYKNNGRAIFGACSRLETSFLDVCCALNNYAVSTLVNPTDLVEQLSLGSFKMDKIGKELSGAEQKRCGETPSPWTFPMSGMGSSTLQLQMEGKRVRVMRLLTVAGHLAFLVATECLPALSYH